MQTISNVIALSNLYAFTTTIQCACAEFYNFAKKSNAAGGGGGVKKMQKKHTFFCEYFFLHYLF
jgi:hypothetical protein